MIFSIWFEIGLLFLGVLYVGDLYFDSFINLIQICRDIDEDNKNKAKDEELKELTKHLYA